MQNILLHFAVIFLQTVYRGDQKTYERAASALHVSANEPEKLPFIPTFADFHLQMRWSKVREFLHHCHTVRSTSKASKNYTLDLCHLPHLTI